ncbi:MAG: GTP cyclohydrolase I [Polyangiales bacterium]
MGDQAAAAAAIDAFRRARGHDPAREPALRGTGARVAALYRDELLDGTRADLDALFADAIPCAAGAQVVAVRGLATHVVCPHHLTIGAGRADVAYLPGDRVLGLGAVARVVDAFAHRLALQEDVGRDVARAVVDRLGARGAACVLRLRHGCLAHHDVKQRGASVTTIALAGSCADGPDRALVLEALRAEAAPRRRKATGAAR